MATEIAVQANVDFDPVLAFMGMTAEEQFDEVAFYDTAGRVLTVVAQGIENEVFNAPLWSPEGDLLAFIQSDTAIGIYRPSDHVLELLGTAPIIPSNDLNSKVGVLLGGWSYDGNWLAYQYAYDVFEGDNYLLNRHTGQSYPLSFPASLVWMEWSPHSTQLAGYTNESIYIAEAPTASDIGNVEVDAQYQRADHSIYRIAWHPDEDGLLVSTSNVHVLEPFNFLWYLDLESGEWTDMGKYPSIVAMTYSPDLTDIAISTTNYATHENELIIIDAEGFKTTTQIELPIGPLFDHIRWITNETLALHGDENLYVLPVREPEEAYWVLDLDNNPLLEAYSRVIIRDWR